MAMPKKDQTDTAKIISALQHLYTSNSEILDSFDELRETIAKLRDAMLELAKYQQHLQQYEEQIYKSFLKNPPKYPYH